MKEKKNNEEKKYEADEEVGEREKKEGEGKKRRKNGSHIYTTDPILKLPQLSVRTIFQFYTIFSFSFRRDDKHFWF